MATENRDWGYTRIRGALSNLGHDVSRGAIATVLREHGLEPAPERTKRTTWREFLAAHWDVMAAADFFTVEVWLPRGLTRFTVLVLIELATRRVEIAGITADPDGPWVTQLARNATDAEDGFLRGRRFLIHDRDPLFTDAVRDTLAAAGVPPVRLPARAPNLNAFAERFVRTIKESCVERFVLIGERSPAPRGLRIRRPLPPRTEPPGPGQPADTSASHTGPTARPHPLSTPPRWDVEVLGRPLTSSRLDRADIGALEVCFWCRSRPPTRRSTSSPRLRRRTNALRPRISVGNDDRLQADRVIGPYALDRRLILIGSYIDSVSQADPVSMARLMKGLDEFLERDQDRALFNLPPPPQRRLPPVLGAFLERFRTDGDGPEWHLRPCGPAVAIRAVVVVGEIVPREVDLSP